MVSQTTKELTAGTLGGIAQVLSGQPFDTVKVRLQTQPDKYNGALDCIRQTLKHEGPFAFYKGTLTPLIGIGACVAVQFAAMESAKRKLSHLSTNPQLMLSGAFSGIATAFLSCPIEHVRSKLQVQTTTSAYKGPVDLVRKVWTGYGIAGVYKGFGITLMRETIGYAIQFWVYGALMDWQMKKQGTLRRGDVSPGLQCLYGGLSGYALWIAIYPIDVIKSRIQTDSLDVVERKYKSSIDCAKQIVARDGVKGLYRGFGTCMARAGPVNGIIFMVYEAAMKTMG